MAEFVYIAALSATNSLSTVASLILVATWEDGPGGDIIDAEGPFKPPTHSFDVQGLCGPPVQLIKWVGRARNLKPTEVSTLTLLRANSPLIAPCLCAFQRLFSATSPRLLFNIANDWGTR